MAPEGLDRLMARLDALHREDPETEVVDGVATPHALADAERLTRWVLRLEPHASEPLRIAARGQHVQRWALPRDRYPMTRAGYLTWRETLKAFHIRVVADLMRAEGYPVDVIDRVRTIMSKRRLSEDPEAQTLEDALCLVFLETQFGQLRRKITDAKMQGVLVKTWRKMSVRAREAARRLPLGEEDRRCLASALSGEGA